MTPVLLAVGVLTLMMFEHLPFGHRNGILTAPLFAVFHRHRYSRSLCDPDGGVLTHEQSFLKRDAISRAGFIAQ